MLRVNHVNKSFGGRHTSEGKQVLRDVCLEVRRGQSTVIIGPSGGGKSTLLRCIHLLTDVDQGSIYLDGELLGYREHAGRRLRLSEGQVARQRASMGMVFQGFNLFPHLTALGNVIEGPISVLHTPQNEAIELGLSLLSKVGLADKADAHPHQLSGGQKQRVAIARTLAMKPKLILFDEPTSALDPELVGEVLDVMVKLSSEGMTLIVVTHEMGFARAVASQVCFMDKGQIVASGPPSQMLDDPSHERLQAFLCKVL